MHCDSSCSTHCGLSGPLGLINPAEGLVSSNDVPSSLQAAAISSAIQRARTDWVRVQDALAVLTAKRTKLEDFIRTNGGVMSSLRRFPNEMLSEIFLRCIDAAATFDPVHNAGWALARVCRRWRSVALTTPDLWSHFVFPGPSDFRRPIPHRLWETQLDRAHNSSLSIRFVAHVPADLLDMFFAVADRWKEVAFANNKVFARFVDLAIEFPFLTKLVVEDDSFGPLLPSGVPGTDLVKRLPTLRHLTLALGSSNSFPPQLRFPWSQLRTCNLGNFRTSHIREVLPLLSPGTHLTLRAPGVGDGSPTPIVTNIQSLEIMDGSSAASRDLLIVLVAPRLQKLLLVERTDPDAITTFLNNSKCTLRHFRILGCMWWQLINILRLPAVGGVVRLEIGYLPMGEWGRLFVELERVEPRLVPDLRTLVLRGDFSCWKISQRLSNRNPVRRVCKGPVDTRK